MPGMNRKGAGGGKAMAGMGNGNCRQSGDATAGGHRCSRRPQDSRQGQSKNRGVGGWSSVTQNRAGVMKPGSPDGGNSAETGQIDRKHDPNQQALDEIMEAVRRMEMESKRRR